MKPISNFNVDLEYNGNFKKGHKMDMKDRCETDSESDKEAIISESIGIGQGLTPANRGGQMRGNHHINEQPVSRNYAPAYFITHR